MLLCYSVTVRNLTLSIPDDVYRQARIRAAEHDTSVSALVSEYLRCLSPEGEEFRRLEAQQREVLTEIRSFHAADRIERDALHERAVR